MGILTPFSAGLSSLNRCILGIACLHNTSEVHATKTVVDKWRNYGVVVFNTLLLAIACGFGKSKFLVCMNGFLSWDSARRFWRSSRVDLCPNLMALHSCYRPNDITRFLPKIIDVSCDGYSKIVLAELVDQFRGPAD